MNNLNETPMGSRFTIGFFGRRNAGKSSLINAITGQTIAITSEVPGTTTDPVYKAMELLPIGPVVFIDTAGLDDVGELGNLRIEKTYEVLRKCNLAIVAADITFGITEFEIDFVSELIKRKIPCIFVFNKCDKRVLDDNELASYRKQIGIPLISVSASMGTGIDELKKLIISNSSFEDSEPMLVGDLISGGDVVILVTPIDKAAPKGRLILPQQQTIRDIIERDAIAVVTKEHELKHTIEMLNSPPKLVITDSQVFNKVDADTPSNILLTSFSILFARQKGDGKRYKEN